MPHEPITEAEIVEWEKEVEAQRSSLSDEDRNVLGRIFAELRRLRAEVEARREFMESNFAEGFFDGTTVEQHFQRERAK